MSPCLGLSKTLLSLADCKLQYLIYMCWTGRCLMMMELLKDQGRFLAFVALCGTWHCFIEDPYLKILTRLLLRR